MVSKMKLFKVKTRDAKPSMRVKVTGNVFVEIHKDNKGFFYKIDVPGHTGYESKERFQDQNKALSSGTNHAKRFIASIKAVKKDGVDEKTFGYVIVAKFHDIWELASVTQPNFYGGKDMNRLKAYAKEVKKQAADLEQAIKFIEKENKK